MTRKKQIKKSTLKNYLRKPLVWILVVLIILLGSLLFLNKNQFISCANAISCIEDLSGNFDQNKKTGEFMGKIVNVPDLALENTTQENVLGDSSSSNKRIYIDLTNQKLYAKEGDRVVYEFLISSGKWGWTPTGDFNIWIKLNSTRMTGGSKEKGTYYDLPNVKWTMFFYNKAIPKSRGYGIHSAYWHNNFGHPMSHGCINMKTEEAKLIYDWVSPVSTSFSTKSTPENPGTPITIYGKAANY